MRIYTTTELYNRLSVHPDTDDRIYSEDGFVGRDYTLAYEAPTQEAVLIEATYDRDNKHLAPWRRRVASAVVNHLL